MDSGTWVLKAVRRNRKRAAQFVLCLLFLYTCGCSITGTDRKPDAEEMERAKQTALRETGSDPEFLLNQVFETGDGTEIHYNLHMPEDYAVTHAYALHIALPGWEGLYFQGTGEDLRWEYMPHESLKYVPDMIVASLQLNSWDRTSAEETVQLTEYLLETYSFDRERVFITGYSAGGETLSHVMELKPELYSAALFLSSKWDGDPAALADAKTPLYLFTAENDSYYGSEPANEAWETIHTLYRNQGLSETEIQKLLVLDVREDAWFDEMMKGNTERTDTQYAMDYHGAGMLAAFDQTVMEWVFQNRR